MGNIDLSAGKIALQLPTLPLAVYREIVAHLQQVDGVEAGLNPQLSQRFEYNQSQVGSVWIHYTDQADQCSRIRVQQILDYYSDRFGEWAVLAPTTALESL
jgi:hypothetical protein